jgi:DNA-binding CsgD family transcriptional regulator
MISEQEKAASEKRTLLDGLATLWPGVRYLAVGVWLSWAFLAYSGTIWLSDVERDGSALANMYLISTAAFAVVCLSAPLLSNQFDRLLSSRIGITAAGLLTALGSLAIVFSGPYYLYSGALFYAGAATTGVGTALLALKCGRMYSGLQPWRALIYAVLSQFVIVLIFFLIVGSEPFLPASPGPSLIGIIALTVLPLVTSGLLNIKPDDASASEGTQAKQYQKEIHLLPSSFWKFLIAIFIFALATSAVRSLHTTVLAPHEILGVTTVAMLFRVVFFIFLLLITIRFFKHINFGKPYLYFTAAIAIFVALVPLLEISTSLLLGIASFALSLFDVALWCLLSFVSFEKRISSNIVFGFGRGIFMLGSALGWLLGARILPQLPDSSLWPVFYIVLAFLVLISTTVIFSEKDFDRLFSPISEMELDLATLSQGPMGGQVKTDKTLENQRPYFIACKKVGKSARLSDREQDILELLALGRGSENIAKKLIISLNTVRTHTHNIYSKLDVHSREELIKLVENERDEVVKKL